MRPGLRWRHGDERVRAAVAAWWRGDASPRGAETIDESAHRRIVRVEGEDGEPLLVKLYRSGTGPHPVRERMKAAIRAGASEREWRALHALRRAGVPAPRPLGLARSGDGDALLVMEAIEAPTLWQVLEHDAGHRRALLRAVADAVFALHRAGLAHGDLHPGNLLVRRGAPIFVDLQRCGPARRGGARQLRDLGLLDYSLRQLGVSRTDRLRVLEGALGLRNAAPGLRRARTRRAVRAAERTSARQTRTRARHGRGPAAGSHWRFDRAHRTS